MIYLIFFVTQVDMGSVVEEGNDKHMGPWAEACTAGGVENTPLTPFMDQELLYNKNLYLDGSRLKGLGFACEVPLLNFQNLMEVRSIRLRPPTNVK